MPLARYFFYVGGVLLALLVIFGAVTPGPPATDRAVANLPVIRIHSDRKLPERVVFDTSLPTITPAQPAKTEASVPAPATVADVSANENVREAFAQLQPSDQAQAQSTDLRTTDLKKPEPQPQRKRRIVKRRVAPPMVLVAQQPQFGFFTNNTW